MGNGMGPPQGKRVPKLGPVSIVILKLSWLPQGGDFTMGNGTGGESIYGAKFPGSPSGKGSTSGKRWVALPTHDG